MGASRPLEALFWGGGGRARWPATDFNDFVVFDREQRAFACLTKSLESLTEGAIGAEQVVNQDGETPVGLPKALSFLIASELLGLRIQEFISGDHETAKEAYEMFAAMLTGAMRHQRKTQQPAGAPSGSD